MRSYSALHGSQETRNELQSAQRVRSLPNARRVADHEHLEGARSGEAPDLASASCARHQPSFFAGVTHPRRPVYAYVHAPTWLARTADTPVNQRQLTRDRLRSAAPDPTSARELKLGAEPAVVSFKDGAIAIALKTLMLSSLATLTGLQPDSGSAARPAGQ